MRKTKNGTRLGRKLKSGLDVLLKKVEITRGGRSTPACLSMFNTTAPRPSCLKMVCRVSLFVRTCLTRILLWLSAISQRQHERRKLKNIALSMMQIESYISNCGGQGSHDFIVDVRITHVPIDSSNIRPKRACGVMDLKSKAVPSF